MKTKYILLLAFSAIITLSFTFISKSNSKKTGETNQVVATPSSPVGGLVLDDGF